MIINIKILDGGKLPEYKTAGAACADCYARTDLTLLPGEPALLPLGFAIELPEQYEAVIRPRSSLSIKYKIDCVIGTIDSDYRGEVKACLVNRSHMPYTVKAGDRVCQLKIQKAEQCYFVAVDELSETERGAGGFGSTGK